MTPPAVVLQVRQAGVAAVLAVHHVVRFTPGRRLVAAAQSVAATSPDRAVRVGRLTARVGGVTKRPAVRMLADGIAAAGADKNGHRRTRVMPGLGLAPWLQRSMGLGIREALGVRKADFRQRADGTRYLPLVPR